VKDYAALTAEGRRRRIKPLAIEGLGAYDLDVVHVRGLTDATNAVYRLDTSGGDRYVMRVGMGPPIGHSPEEVDAEVELLEAVSGEPDIDVPRPVRRRDGGFVTMLSGPGVPHSRPSVIFTWLPGPLLADRLDERGLILFGGAIARLHDAGRRFEPSSVFRAPRFDRVYPYDLPFLVFSTAGRDLLPPPRRRLFEEAFALVEDAIADLGRREPVRILHGDLHPWNAKVFRGRVAVFDFEDMVWGWPVQDLGTAIYYLWTDDRFDAQWAALRAGYEEVAAWPDAGSDVATFIVARTLLMANDVISQPEWLEVAPEIYERGERRIIDMLRRIG
jgi:Ser/Thr protein kinase RdoA (MazF antagonist)